MCSGNAHCLGQTDNTSFIWKCDDCGKVFYGDAFDRHLAASGLTSVPADRLGAPPQELITLSDLLRKCGFFGSSSETEELPNDGFICRHPNQNERQDGYGICEGWACPIACLACMEDLRKLDPDLFAQYTVDFPNDDDMPQGGETWMLYEPPDIASTLDITLGFATR
jgi:hypothetical protein